MFDLKKEVPSLELCKKLKDLGYPQSGGGYYWTIDRQGKVFLSFFEKMTNEDIEHDLKINNLERIKAPTIRELGEHLPKFAASLKEKNWWECYTDFWKRREGKHYIEVDELEANARAKMLIRLYSIKEK